MVFNGLLLVLIIGNSVKDAVDWCEKGQCNYWEVLIFHSYNFMEHLKVLIMKSKVFNFFYTLSFLMMNNKYCE